MIYGYVRNINGVALPNIPITLKNINTGATKTVYTLDQQIAGYGIGFYHFEQFDIGEYTVSVNYSNYIPYTSSTIYVTDLTVNIEHNISLAVSSVLPGTIRGIATDKDTHQPLWVFVEIIPPSANAVYANSSTGEYVINSVPPGTYTVKAKCNGYVDKSYSGVIVSPGISITQDIELEKHILVDGTINGFVRNTDGVGIEGVKVYTNPATKTFNSIAEGYYELSRIPLNTYEIISSASGYNINSVPNVILNTNEMQVDIIMNTPQPPIIIQSRIHGTVKSKIDNYVYAIDGAVVTATTEDNILSQSIFTSNNGFYELAVPVGIYNLKVECSGYNTIISSSIDASIPNGHIKIDFDLVESNPLVSPSNYADVKRLYDENAPAISTIRDYQGYISSSKNIIDNNKAIITKLNDIIPAFISHSRVRYDVTNLYSDKQFKVSVNPSESIYYTGKYHYAYKSSSFFSGATERDDKPIQVDGYEIYPNTKLIYIKKQNIEDIFKVSNFNFSSILVEQSNNIQNNYELFRVMANSMAVSLNKKLSFNVGLQNAMFKYYSNYESIIKSNLKYFRNYNEVKRFSVSRQIKVINFNGAYADFLDKVVNFHTVNNNSSTLINEAIGITATTNTPYFEFVNMVKIESEPTALTDPNYDLVKAFYNINFKLSEFIKDFEYMDSIQRKDEYYAFLLTAIDLKIGDILGETYDGLSYLQEKLSKYIVDKIKEPYDLATRNLMIKNDVVKVALSDIVLSLSKFLEVVKNLKFIFDMNLNYNIFIDFDVKNSVSARNILKANGMSVHQLVKNYEAHKATTWRITDCWSNLNYITPLKPLISSFKHLGRVEGLGDIRVVFVGSFVIPLTTVKELKIQRVDIFSSNSYANTSVDMPAPWDWNRIDSLWEWSTVERSFAQVFGTIYRTDISYKWKDKDGNWHDELQQCASLLIPRET